MKYQWVYLIKMNCKNWNSILNGNKRTRKRFHADWKLISLNLSIFFLWKQLAISDVIGDARFLFAARVATYRSSQRVRLMHGRFQWLCEWISHYYRYVYFISVLLHYLYCWTMEQRLTLAKRENGCDWMKNHHCFFTEIRILQICSMISKFHTNFSIFKWECNTEKRLCPYWTGSERCRGSRKESWEHFDVWTNICWWGTMFCFYLQREPVVNKIKVFIASSSIWKCFVPILLREKWGWKERWSEKDEKCLHWELAYDCVYIRPLASCKIYQAKPVKSRLNGSIAAFPILTTCRWNFKYSLLTIKPVYRLK